MPLGRQLGPPRPDGRQMNRMWVLQLVVILAALYCGGVFGYRFTLAGPSSTTLSALILATLPGWLVITGAGVTIVKRYDALIARLREFERAAPPGRKE